MDLKLQSRLSFLLTFLQQIDENLVMYQIFITRLLPICILHVSFLHSDLIPINFKTRCGHIGYEVVASGDSRVKGKWTRVTYGDHYKHNCTRGIGFLATIFGRQAVGKVLATRESDIKRETRRDMKDNEATGLKEADTRCYVRVECVSRWRSFC